MKIAKWKDYQIIATGDGEKLERWGKVFLLRPDPQVIWPAEFDLAKYKGLSAHYFRSEKGGGAWDKLSHFPDEWQIGYDSHSGRLNFIVKPMGFKHTGLFPEQAVNWDFMQKIIQKNVKAGRAVKVLNLFGYTGGATVACSKAGAEVCHVDSAKAMVDRCKENAKLSGCENNKIRYIVDDCEKFVAREIKRGNKYDIIIMDPPSFGRGPNGEVWKLEEKLFTLVQNCVKVLSQKPILFLINSYTTGLQPMVLKNILQKNLKGFAGSFDAYEVGIATDEEITLPCGASGVFVGE